MSPGGKNYQTSSLWLPTKLYIPRYIIPNIFINQFKYSQIFIVISPLICGLFKSILLNLRIILPLILAVSNFWFNYTTDREHTWDYFSIFKFVEKLL